MPEFNVIYHAWFFFCYANGGGFGENIKNVLWSARGRTSLTSRVHGTWRDNRTKQQNHHKTSLSTLSRSVFALYFLFVVTFCAQDKGDIAAEESERILEGLCRAVFINKRVQGDWRNRKASTISQSILNYSNRTLRVCGVFFAGNALENGIKLCADGGVLSNWCSMSKNAWRRRNLFSTII